MPNLSTPADADAQASSPNGPMTYGRSSADSPFEYEVYPHALATSSDSREGYGFSRSR